MAEGQGNITYGPLGLINSILAKLVTIQFQFVVGGPDNFASIPGAPAVPVAGAASMTTPLLAGVNVRMSRGGLWQLGFNPLDGNTYYTKAKAANTINFFTPLAAGEEIIIETIPL